MAKKKFRKFVRNFTKARKTKREKEEWTNYLKDYKDMGVFEGINFDRKRGSLNE